MRGSERYRLIARIEGVQFLSAIRVLDSEVMQKPTEQWTVSTINFLAEQDGPPERELKQALADVFAQIGS